MTIENAIEGEASTLLDTVHARRIAAATISASRDGARPILTHTVVSITDGVLQTVQTDSYRLGWTMTPLDHPDVEPFQVVAKDLSAAFKQPTKAGKYLHVTIDPATGVYVDLGANRLGAQVEDCGTYPQWRQLIDGFGPVGDAIRAGTMFTREQLAESQVAAFAAGIDTAEATGYNADYLADIGKGIAPTAKERSFPVTLLPGDTTLKPSIFAWVGGGQCGATLLMPVRT